MKRKGLVTLAGINDNTFDLWQKRGLLPFASEGGRWTDYTLTNALQVRLMADLAKVTDLRTASEIASAAGDLRPHPFWATGDDVYLCGTVYEYPGEDGTIRETAAWGGRDGDGITGGRIVLPDYRAVAHLAVNASAAAREILTAALELGIPHDDGIPPIPEDLTRFPAWFRDYEMQRREIVFGTPAAVEPGTPGPEGGE